MVQLATLLLENDAKYDWTPFIKGFLAKDNSKTRALLYKLDTLLRSMAVKMRGGDDPIIDDWINDWVGKKLPKVAKAAAKNIDSGRYRPGQFPALVTTSFRRYVLNQLVAEKRRKAREMDVGRGRGTYSSGSQMASSDRQAIRKIVAREIEREKDEDVRRFLRALVGLDGGRELNFTGLSRGSAKDAMKRAGVKLSTSHATKAKQRLFKNVASNRTVRKMMGVESKSVFGPGLEESVKLAGLTKPRSGLLPRKKPDQAFFEWLIRSMHE